MDVLMLALIAAGYAVVRGFAHWCGRLLERT